MPEMSNILGSKSQALRSLLAHPSAIEAISHGRTSNHVPGFGRKATMPRKPFSNSTTNQKIGEHADVNNVASLRGHVLETRLRQEISQQGALDVFLSAMRLIAARFSAGANLQTQMENFFASLDTLNTDSDNTALRQAALTAAQKLAEAFRSTSRALSSLHDGLNNQTLAAINEVNRICGEIAVLNRRLEMLAGTAAEKSRLEAERHEFIRELASKIDLSATNGSVGQSFSSLALTTSSGTLLVEGERSVPLSATADPTSGNHHIVSQGTDVTTAIAAGQLGGLLRMCDMAIPALLADLDALARAIAKDVTSSFHAGFDLNGTGNSFFASTSGEARVAATMTVQVTSAEHVHFCHNVVASNPASSCGQNHLNGLASISIRVKDDVSVAETELEALALTLRQLQQMLDATKTESMEEEGATLLRYQRAFESAARVVSTTDELTRSSL